MICSIGVQVKSYDLVAVHRLGRFQHGKCRSVIVRFLSRKKTYESISNSKNLVTASNGIYKKLFITENLCSTNRKIFNYLYKLKKEKRVINAWTKNGEVFCKFTAREDDHAKKVEYFEDINYYLDMNTEP